MKYYRIVEISHPNYTYRIIEKKVFFNLFWMEINYNGCIGSMKYDTPDGARERLGCIINMDVKPRKEIILTLTTD